MTHSVSAMLREARLYLPYVSPISPLHLPYISTISPLYLPGWAAKSFSGITLLELAPGTVRTSQTVDVHECDLSSANRRLHHGWR